MAGTGPASRGERDDVSATAAAAQSTTQQRESDAAAAAAASVRGYGGAGSCGSDDDEDDDDEEEDDEGKNLYALHNLVEQGAIDSLRALLPLKKTVAAATGLGDEDEEDDEYAHMRSMQVMANESLLLEKDDMGCLPIHIAIIYQRRECAMHLLKYSEALTSAMLRIKCGDLNTPIVHLILRVGALNPDFATFVISQLFDDAATDESTLAAGFSDDVKALLFEKMVAKDEEGNSVFHLCAMYDLPLCLDVFAAFYARQAEQHQQNTSSDGGSSSKSKKLSTIKPLLEKSNRVGFRPLHSAMKFHSTQVVRQLVADYSVNVNSVTTLQQTPVHIAALAGFADGVALLLADTRASSLVDLTLEDNHGYTAMQLAKKAKFAQVVQLLSSENQDNGEEEETPPQMTTTTKFFFHPESLRHLPMAYHRRGGPEPPPENPERIDTLVDPLFGILRSKEFVKEHVVWDYDIEQADIADVLRVHEFHYVDKIRKHCAQLAGPVVSGDDDDDDDNDDNDEDKEGCGKTFTLDPDTALSLRSYDAATRAAGAVCKAVDQVMNGDCTNAFCVVRPPGHHAGPVGKVVCENDPEGSHGFCLFNNVAIGAAYARSHYKSKGIQKIAILDFDVHHGNGTEEIVRQLVPHTEELRFETPYGEGKQIVHQYKPWRSEDDAENVFFCSVHGYGHKDPKHDHDHGSGPQAAWFYPGSGESSVKQAPLIWNVGLEFCKDGASASRLKWRSAFRDDILPKLRAFAPDLIFLSAGFDAHKKENVNWGYVSLLEQDYEWLVHHVKQVANACCNGRLISVLEGGYNFHGRMVSPFARSVAAHARALIHPSQERWDEQDIAKEAAHERVLLANYAPSQAAAAAGSGSVNTISVLSATSKKRSTDGAGTTTAADGAEERGAQVSMAVSRSKRARKDVDYVALAEELAHKSSRK